MTWQELADRIKQMTPEQLQQPARFHEPYDKMATTWEVSVYIAEEDFDRDGDLDDDDMDDSGVILEGQPYLTP